MRGDLMRAWLEKIRKKAGLTQEETAKLSNIARTTYAMIEQGKRDPSVRVAKDIAKTLNFNWTLFFEKELHETRINEKDASEKVC